jgi:hypothetical protein
VTNKINYAQHTAAEYALDKPLLIGEFSTACGEGMQINDMMDHLYYNGYSVRFV